MRVWVLDPSAWRRKTDGWRLTIDGHTVDLCEGPPRHLTPIVDRLTKVTPFRGAACDGLVGAAAYAYAYAYACPLVAEVIGGSAAGTPTPAQPVVSPR